MNANTTSLIQCLRKLVAPQSFAQEPDPQLLERFLTQRSEAAFAALVQRHGPMVLNVCRRVLHNAEDAEDAFQATFLVLARKAGSIHKEESVGSWLHGVAFRVSRMCKAKEARRQKCQRGLPLPQSTDAEDDIHWRELRSLLDEELGKLPEKYRAPLVLCYLEGRTRDEASQQLGVSKAVFRRRLEYGRERLGRQLTRRGVTLSAALSAPLLIDAAAQASLPPLLAASTVRAGLAAALGNTLSGIVSAQVAALAESSVGSLLVKKTSIALVLLMSLTLGIGGLLVHRAVSDGTSADAPAEPPPQSPPAHSTSKDKAIEIKGRVLDPDGKPFAGAHLFLLSGDNQKEANKPVRATTDKDGHFRFRVRSADFGPQGKGVLAATAKGFGLDWIDVDTKTRNKEIALRLVADDKPIVGRVLDLEGKPIAGITVQVRSVRKQADGSDLAAWTERNVKAKWVADSELDKLTKLLPAGLNVRAMVASGDDGRFRLIGFGRDRILRLAIRGPNTADADFHAATRAAPAKGWISGESGLHFARFDYVIAPCKPVAGAVRDKRTGKPLAGITVAAVDGMRWCETKTDDQGRYRIAGLAKNKEYGVGAGGMPYINCPKNHVADTPGLEPLNVNFDLARGIAVKGRLIDKTTGKPVRGHVRYLTLPDNPYLKDFADLNKGGILAYNPGGTAADGSFTVVAIPGPGWLVAQAKDVNQFAHMEGADDVSHARLRINLSEEDAKSTTYEIALEPAGILKGSVLGPDNRPLAGAYTAGCSPVIHPYLFVHEKLDSNTFTVGGLKHGRPRILTFYHREKKLGKVLRLQGDETKPLVVRLEPLGAIAGRILDAKGRPWAGLNVSGFLTGVDKTYPPEFHWGGSSWLKFTQFETTTDREGIFRIDGLLPGLKYGLFAYEGKLVIRPDVALPYRVDGLTIESCKEKDLGDLKSKLMPDK